MEIELLIEQKELDVICLTEILPKSKKYPLDAKTYELSGNTLHLSQLEKRGTAVYIKSTYDSESLELVNSSSDISACYVK